MVQWLRLHASNAGGMVLIPDRGAKLQHAIQGNLKLQKEFTKRGKKNF